jgi:glycosyltransferase involved in cell wall biosynthesis
MTARCILIRDPRVPAGGFETWVETLAHGLPARGVQTTVLVPGQNIEASDDNYAQARAVVAALQMLARDGGHGVFFSGGHSYIDIAALNLRGSPFAPVMVLHGRHPSTFEWIAAGPPRKIVVPSADFAAVVRRELRRRARWFRAIRRVVVIPHGVAVPSIDDKLTRPILSPLKVVAVTRLNEDAKRPFDLLHIAACAKNRGLSIVLTIAGTGPAEERMRSEAGENVVLAGLVPHDRISDLLLASDVLVSTSASEAFGLAVAEALACGCAVVAADVPGPLREMVTSATGRRVPVGDIDAFVTMLANMGDDIRAMGQAGHQLVSRRFSDVCMLDAYARLVAQIPTRPDGNWQAPAVLIDSPTAAVLPPIRQRLRSLLRK